jgi:hypothetical protein
MTYVGKAGELVLQRSSCIYSNCALTCRLSTPLLRSSHGRCLIPFPNYTPTFFFSIFEHLEIHDTSHNFLFCICSCLRSLQRSVSFTTIFRNPQDKNIWKTTNFIVRSFTLMECGNCKCISVSRGL